MLSVIRRLFQAPVTNAEDTWFELWLFKTHLRLLLPKKSAFEPKEASSTASNVDLRPFVNTEARHLYHRIDELGYYALPFYESTWYYSSASHNASAKLKFNLDGYAVTTPDLDYYPDLQEHHKAISWLKYYYASREKFYSQFYLQKHTDNSLEIISESSDKRSLKTECDVFQTATNGHALFKVQQQENLISYWLPFSERDFLRFDFSLQSLTDIPEEEKEQIVQWAEDLSQSIISSVVLRYPDQKTLNKS